MLFYPSQRWLSQEKCQKIYHLNFWDIFWRRGINHNIPAAYCQLWELQMSEEMAERVGSVCPSVMNHYLLDSMVGNPKPLPWQAVLPTEKYYQSCIAFAQDKKRGHHSGDTIYYCLSLIWLPAKNLILQNSSIFTQVFF